MTATVYGITLPNSPAPGDQNLVAWTYDPAHAWGSSTTSAGVVQLSQLIVRQPATVTNLIVDVSTGGTGLTSGGNWAGLYNSSGTLLSATADQTTPWGSAGAKTMALTSAQAVAAGVYYLALLSNASTTLPAFARGSVLSTSTLNAGVTASAPRYATSGSGLSTLPSSITLSGATQMAIAWWGAFS